MTVPFEYAAIRAVPRVDRGECINVAVLVWCQAEDWLGAAVDLDVARLRALDPSADVDGVRAALDAITAVCDGDAAGGEAATLPPGKRFRFLTAPRSTVVQAGPVHVGMTTDPRAQLATLLDRLVRT